MGTGRNRGPILTCGSVKRVSKVDELADFDAQEVSALVGLEPIPAGRVKRICQTQNPRFAGW